MGVLLGPVEPAHAHAQIGANVVTKRQTAVMVEFFDKVFHSEPPSCFKRGSERKSAAERGGQENRPVLMREVGSISYYAVRLPVRLGLPRKTNRSRELCPASDSYSDSVFVLRGAPRDRIKRLRIRMRQR